jgi:toxin ParE1/3/4
MEFILLPEAEREIREAHAWYAERSHRVARVFVATLDERLEMLRRQPEACPIFVDAIRRCVLRRFPFGICYVVREGNIHLLALAHHSRMPGYWRKRGL